MATAAMAMSRRASLAASLKNISAVALLLCAAAVAASFLPLSSAGVSLVSLTCRKTAHERQCISTLASDRRSDAAGSVQQLAVIALTIARNSTRDAVWRATVLGSRAATTPLERDRLAQCRALYADALRETTRTIALVTAATYDAAVRATSTLHWYPEKCQSLLYKQGVKSAMERTNKQVEEQLIASTDLVHLLLAPRGAGNLNLVD